MPDPEQTPGPRRRDLVRRLARPMGVVSGYSLSLAGTGMLLAVLAVHAAAGTLLALAATAWRRHRPASRAPQRAAQAAGAAAASLAS